MCRTTVKCIECGGDLAAERADLGYEYCTKPRCQDARRRGLTVTAVGVNKSADVFVIADEAEIRKRAEAGEFTRKDTSLGVDYRADGTPSPTPPPRKPVSRPVPRVSAPRRAPAWSPQQERVVRLYHQMGLNPRQIMERVRENAPQLALTEGLVTRILCSRPPRS